MQMYSSELFDLYTQGAFKLEIWKDGYPFSAEGMKQAHADLCRHFSRFSVREELILNS